MQALRILGEEHLWIARMINCLQRIVELEQETGELDIATASEVLELFANIGGGRHQEKEEQQLFPRVRVHADAEQEAEIQKLEQEHVNDVKHMIRLHSALQGALHGDEISRREFPRFAAEYVEIERRHMTKEKMILFPMAERLLTKRDDNAMVEAFAKLDPRGPQQLERAANQMRALCERLGVELPGAAAS